VKSKRNNRNIEDEISFFTSGLSDFASISGIGIGATKRSIGNPFKHLKKIVKKKMRPYGLEFVTIPQEAKYMVIMYAEFDNDDGYDCLGFNCYKKSMLGKFPKVDSIRYPGVCGDVNTLRFNEKNSKVLYLGTV